MARSYCRLLLNTLPRKSKAFASAGSSRTAVLASLSARSSRPDGRDWRWSARGRRARFSDRGQWRGRDRQRRAASCCIPIGGAAVDQARRPDPAVCPWRRRSGRCRRRCAVPARTRCRRRPRRFRRWRWIAPGQAPLKRQDRQAAASDGIEWRMGAPWQASVRGGNRHRSSQSHQDAKRFRPSAAAFSFKCGKRSLKSEPW